MSHRLLAGLALAALVPALAMAAPKKDVAPPAHLPTNAELTSRSKTAPAGPVEIAPTEADWRTPDPDNLMVIDTNKGRIIIEMYPLLAPASVAQLKTLTKRHFYDGLTFFRVVDEFMDQTGDPKNNGEGGSDLPNLKGEFTFKHSADTPWLTVTSSSAVSVGFMDAMPVASQPEDLMAMTADGKVTAWGLYCPAVAAMARANDPDSANSQFFLMRDAYPSLTKKYTPWGKIIAGQDVVRSIKVGEPVEAPQDRMVTVRLASDMPPAKRPKIQVLDTRGPAFRSQIAKILAEKNAGFSLCDVPIATRTN